VPKARATRTRCCSPRAAVSGGARHVAEGRNREVVADYSGDRHQGGVIGTCDCIRAETPRESSPVANSCIRQSVLPPCRSMPPDQRYELAPLHSITLSARATRPAGTFSPIAFAAFRLMTNSNRAGCSTGMSAGLVPRNIFATMRARWRNVSVSRGP